MREIDAEHAEERARLRGAQQGSRSFLEEMAQAGLVDDIAPDGPIIPIPPLEVQCGRCGAKMECGEFIDSHSEVCR